MSARAGVAYIDMRGDWSAFNRQFAARGSALSRDAGKLGTRIGGRMSHGITTASKGAILAAAGGFVYAGKKAADFESQLSSLDAVADANARQMERLRKQAIRAGAATKFSALDAAEAQTELAKGGLRTGQILKGGLNSALALAAAGQLDLSDAAETTVNAMKLFGLRGKQSMRVADALATAANRTTADVSDFSIAFRMGGSAAKAAGLDFNETTASLEALAEIGIKGSDAGTSLKAMLMQLAKPTAKASELMAKLGLDVFDAEGNMKPLPKVAGEFRKALGRLTREQRLADAGTLVGTDGMRAMLALYDAGPKKIAKFEQQLAKHGTAADVAKKKQDNLKGSAEQLSGSVETLGIQLGTAAIPAMRTAADEVTELTNRITRIVSRDDLDLGEKLNKIFDVAEVQADPWIDKLKAAVEKADLPGKLADGISAATPVLAGAAAKAAPVVAGAFVRSWMEASPWGRLAMGGFLLSKMGGPAAFRGLGNRIGREMVPGIAAGVSAGTAAGTGVGAAIGAAAASQTVNWVNGPGGAMVAQVGTTMGTGTGKAMGPAVASGFAASGVKGRLTGLMRSWGPGIAAALGLTFGPEVLKAARQGVADKTPSFKLPSFEGSQGGIPGLKNLQHWADRLFDSEKRLKGFGDTAEKQFARAQKAGDAAGLARLAEQARRLARDFPGASIELGRFADAATAAAGDAAGSFRSMSELGGKSLKRIKTATANTGFDIKQTLGYDTEAARKALAKNFAGAARAVKESMDAGVISTKKGTRLIEQYMVAALQNMGFTKEQALKVRQGRDPVSGKATGGKQNLTNKRRGGPIHGGLPSGDSIPALLERGEYVMNREAVKKIGRGVLDRVNFGLAPRFQGGGMVHVPGDPPGPFGDSVSGAVAGLAALIVRLFHANITAGFDPGGRHKSPGHNVTGTAIDIVPGAGGSWGMIGDAVRWATSRGMTVYYDGSNGSVALANHGPGNHAHIELGSGSAGGALAAIAPRLARVAVDGPDSPLKAIVQSALDTTRAAAQDKINTLITAPGSEGSEPGGGLGSGSGSGAELMRRIAGQRGWNFGDWWRLDARETGHGANLTNPTSTARLRGQFLDMNWGTYGPGSDPRQNPTMGQQIWSMAEYIADRYGSPSAALAFHLAHNFYRAGGPVGMDIGGSPGKYTPSKTPTTLSGVLKAVRTSKNPKTRRAAVNSLLEKVKKIGLPQDLQKRLTSYGGDAAKFADYAERAGQLTGDGTTAGLINGKTETEWLGEQLQALFRWRNAIIDAEQIVTQRREQTSTLIERARKRLTDVRGTLGTIGNTRRTLTRQLEAARKHPSKNRPLIRSLTGKLKDLNTQERINTRVKDALHDKILPALTGKRSSLNTTRGELLSSLEDVQGVGSPMTKLTTLPAVGTLGGSIFGVQMRLRELGAAATATDTSSSGGDDDRLAVVNELLRQANLRTAISEKQFDVLRGMPPFGGSFADGGTVPGPVGAPRTIVAHGGETVTPPGQNGPNFRVVIQDDRVRVFVDDIEQAVERVTRRQARAGARGLPGRAGGGIR